MTHDLGDDDSERDFETLRGIRRVAVIGAGASGCPAARHLREHGLAVRVFERQAQAGGIWAWSPDVARLELPTPPPSRAAFDPARPEHGPFSPPNPVYANLSNNVPTSTMVFKDFPYPPGTAENVPHDVLAAYVRDYAAHFGVNELVSYDTRVERAAKDGREWVVRVRHKSGRVWEERFDALIVATGHYNAPFVPPLPGLEAWAARWPDKVLHTTAYRRPEEYTGQTVLVVGLGTSGLDIARDIVAHNPPPSPPTPPSGHLSDDDAGDAGDTGNTSGASTPPTSVELDEPRPTRVLISAREPYGPAQYHAQRTGQRRLAPAPLLPEIAELLPPKASMNESVIRFQDGSVRAGFDAVIFATGYQYSFPFLGHLHRDPGVGEQVASGPDPGGPEASDAAAAKGLGQTSQAGEQREARFDGDGESARWAKDGTIPKPGDASDAAPQPLVTDGKGVHGLYRDVFTVSDPTLAFVGVSVNTSAFAFFEYQSLSVARVFAGRARLPSLTRRRDLHAQWLSERGGGKFAHLMGVDRERAYVRETVAWLNAEAARTGDARVEGHSEEWLAASDRFKAAIAARWKIDV